MKYISFSFLLFKAPFLFPALLVSLFVIGFPSVICTYVWHVCDNSTTFTNASTYSTNLNLVINDLFRNAPQSLAGFNTSSHGRSPNKVYGLLQCNGNMSAMKCSNCVAEANNSIRERCNNDMGGRIWLDDCFMRYHKTNFISTLDTTRAPILLNNNTITGQAFKSTTSSLLSNLSDEAYIPANKGFAAGSANYSSSGKLYGLVQCWRDISIEDCGRCLVKARRDVKSCCSSNGGAQVLLGSCKVRYETYSFFDSAQPSSPSPYIAPSPSTSDSSTTTPPPSIGLSPNTDNGASSMSRFSLWVLVGVWGMWWNV